MAHTNTIFHQVLSIIPREEFERLVEKYGTDKWYRKFTSWNHFACLAYTQLKQRDSLRDVQVSLESQTKKLAHLGIRSVKRSTFSDANQKRPYQLFKELFYVLHARFLKLGQKKLKGIDRKAISLDATVIQLCHTLFPWSRFQKEKGGIKLHMGYDLGNHIPEFVVLTDGNTNERKVAPQLSLEPDSIVVFDRGYFNTKWFADLDESRIGFVTRPNRSVHYQVTGQLDLPQNAPHILKDEWIQLSGSRAANMYRKKLRLVTVQDPDTGKIFSILTNLCHLDAPTISLLYKQRWQIELFFKWLKQNLKIKSFLGTSKNAVLSQVWSAMIVYILLKFLKSQTRYPHSLLNLQRILNETIFERSSIIDILNLRPNQSNLLSTFQLSLFFP